LFHLEIGDAITQKSADAISLLEQHDVMARARELLSARHARRAGSHDGGALAGLFRWRKRQHPAFFPPLVDDEMLDRLDPDRIVIDVERARLFARRRADPPRELREIVGG